MVEIREKGGAPRYAAKVNKQDYYICLAKTLFGGSSEDEKAFFKWAMDQAWKQQSPDKEKNIKTSSGLWAYLTNQPNQSDYERYE